MIIDNRFEELDKYLAGLEMRLVKFDNKPIMIADIAYVRGFVKGLSVTQADIDDKVIEESLSVGFKG